MIEEGLTFFQPVFGEFTLVTPADVAGTHVLQTGEVLARTAELEDARRAADVDLVCDVLGNGEVIDGRKVPDLGDVVESLALLRIDPKTICGDVPSDQLDPADSVEELFLYLADSLSGCRQVLPLNQANRLYAVAAGKQSGQQRRAEEARETGHQ